MNAIVDKTPVASIAHIATAWLADFEAALGRRAYAQAAAAFAPNGYWRDLLAFTWDIRTRQGPAAIETGLAETCEATGPNGFRLEQDPMPGQLGPFGATIDAFFRFDTQVAEGRGFMRLVADPDEPGTWRALTLLTTMQGLKAFPDAPFVRRRRESMRVPERGTENWLDRRRATVEFRDADPEVVVIGAGQAGLTLAARLGQLDVGTLVVDKMERIGDNWRKRYHSLTLHNEICTNHLPYMPFPDTWPVYIPKDMLADWLEFYAKSMELNVWTETTFLGATRDDDGHWTVRLRRADGSERTMRPRHVVMAIGVSGIAKMPTFDGADDFEGAIVHSSGPTDDLDVAGKSALVVGSGTSGHDIAQDLAMRGADVTMLQRSSTTVVSLEPGSVRAYALYRQNEGVRPIADTDLITGSIPYDLLRQLHGPLSRQIAQIDKELLDGLRDAGFMLDNGEDDTGFFMKLVRYLGGYYINVGASDMIIDGRIKLKTGTGVERLTRKSVRFADGSSLDADLIVMATGYRPLQDAVRAMFGDAVAERVGPIWGLGPDGELRNMWSRTAQDGFFVVGGTLTMCRLYSRFTALLIKASLEKLIAPKATQ